MPALKAIIFDFDGVLADSEPLHFRAFQAVLAEENIALSEHEYATHYIGLTDIECFQAVFKARNRPLKADAIRSLVERKTARMLDVLRAQDVMTPGATDFVRALSKQYRLAIASGALRNEIVLALELAGIHDAFETIVSAEDVRAGKPHPGLYLRALSRLNSTSTLKTCECLSIEDTPYGIRSAHAAGLRCLAVTTTLRREKLLMADGVIPSLRSADFRVFVRRFWDDSRVSTHI